MQRAQEGKEDGESPTEAVLHALSFKEKKKVKVSRKKNNHVQKLKRREEKFWKRQTEDMFHNSLISAYQTLGPSERISMATALTVAGKAGRSETETALSCYP